MSWSRWPMVDSGDERRGPARHRRRVRCRPVRPTASPGQVASAANLRALMALSEIRRAIAPRPAPGSRTHTPALLAAGGGAGPRHHRARRHCCRDRARVRDRQPRGHPGRARGVERQLPRRAARLSARLPGHRRGRPGEHRRAPDRPFPRSARNSGLPRSWPRTRASTPAT